MKKIIKIIPTLAAISLIILFAACDNPHKAELLAIQSMMDSHPDSALITLEEFDLPDRSGNDVQALYGLLLTQARYKNYIDEVNDSLIRSSADYFINAGDEKNAGMAMFQRGMILINAGRYGEAAVTLERALDLAKRKGLVDVEAYCARGLNTLYNSLMDGAMEVKYANEAYKAFLALGDIKRANYARLNVAIALVNHEQYDKALTEAESLSIIASESRDTALMAETCRIMGIAHLGMEQMSEAISDYIRAYELDSTKLTHDDRCNVMIMIDGMDTNTIPHQAHDIVAPLLAEDSLGVPFELLAAQGRYKEAFTDLKRYRARQDSILSSITRSTASEAVMSYREKELSLQRERMLNERMVWVLVIVCVLFIGAGCVQRYRRKMHDKLMQQEALVNDAESLRADFLYQVEINKRISGSLRDLFLQEFAVVDKLCSAYYESDEPKREKQRVVKEVEKIIDKLSKDTAYFAQLQEYADRYTDGLYTSFKKDFPNLKEADYRLFLYLLLGFSARSISLLLSEKIDVVYNRKSRLKAKIKDSNIDNNTKYLAIFGVVDLG